MRIRNVFHYNNKIVASDIDSAKEPPVAGMLAMGGFFYVKSRRGKIGATTIQTPSLVFAIKNAAMRPFDVFGVFGGVWD